MLAGKSVLVKRRRTSVSASASAVGTCCFGNFACFGGIVQRLVLGARAVWLLLPVLLLVAAARAVWLLLGLCGCC